MERKTYLIKCVFFRIRVSKVSFMIFLLLLVRIISNSQVLNGSFENSSNPNLSNWEWTCGADSYNNAPPGGGSWCIKVHAGNFQGLCMKGIAYQKIPNVTNDQTYELSGWEYAINTTAGIYFGTMNNGNITYHSGALVSDTSWVKISIESNFQLFAGDTAVVVLDCLTTGGAITGYGYFDLINLKLVSGLPYYENNKIFKIFPNPFNASTILEIITETPTMNFEFSLYNVFGQKVLYSKIKNPKTEIPRGNLSSGVYFILLTNENKEIASQKLVITD